MNFYYLFENHFKVVLPELFLSIALTALLMYGLFLRPVDDGASTTINVNWLSIYTLLITLALVVNNPIGRTTIFNNFLIHDPLTSLVKGFVLIGAFASLLMSMEYFKFERLHAFEYSILVLMATDALLLLVSAYDLISIYMAIELQALSLYVLAASKRNSEFSTEAGLKYFILGAFSSGLLLFGISILYGFTGMTNLGDLVSFFVGYSWSSLDGFLDGDLASLGGLEVLNRNGANVAPVLALAFIGAAFLFKLAVVPFHMWAPDVYEGAPTSVTAFFAITPKIAIFLVLFRFYFYAFYGFSHIWSSLMVGLSMASMLVAAFAALYQTKIKRLLAYSAIGHVGYMLVGVATGTSEGIQAILAYAFIYMITTIAVFAIVLALTDKNGMGVKYITDLSGLSKKNPTLAAILSIMLFSLAGIPPFAGFYGKFYLFVAAIEESMYLLAIVGVLSSVVGALYYIRIIKIMYFEEQKKDVVNSFRVTDIEKGLVIAVSTLFVVLFAVYPAPLLLLTQKVGFIFLI